MSFLQRNTPLNIIIDPLVIKESNDLKFSLEFGNKTVNQALNLLCIQTGLTPDDPAGTLCGLSSDLEKYAKLRIRTYDVADLLDQFTLGQLSQIVTMSNQGALANNQGTVQTMGQSYLIVTQPAAGHEALEGVLSRLRQEEDDTTSTMR